jgi:hypothetical protein
MPQAWDLNTVGNSWPENNKHNSLKNTHRLKGHRTQNDFQKLYSSYNNVNSDNILN